MRAKTEQVEVNRSNSETKLDRIQREINKIARRNIFQLGKLLLKAREHCSHGEWGAWLRQAFAWSEDSASNYMAAEKLAQKFRTVRSLKVPARAIYRLTALNPKHTADAIVALKSASKTRSLSVAESERILSQFEDRKERGRDETLAVELIHTDVAHAIATILRDAGCKDTTVDAVSIQVAIDHLSELARKMQGDDPVKAAADRAEARSRQVSNVLQFPA